MDCVGYFHGCHCPRCDWLDGLSNRQRAKHFTNADIQDLMTFPGIGPTGRGYWAELIYQTQRIDVFDLV